MADVTIFEHFNFEGRSQVLAKGRYALEEISIGNDALSSLKVPQGLVVRLYEHYHFQGRFIDIKADTPVISQLWNDRTSSIIVYDEAEQPPLTKEVIIFEHFNHVGKSQILQKGEYDVAQILIGDDTLSSALVPTGMKLRLYEHANFQGAFVDIREDTKAVNLDWNDRASSIVVMADFPENEIEILPDFLSDDLNTLWGPMGTALSASDISTTGQITGPNANLVNQIRSARQQLTRFLDHAATLMVLGTFGKQFKTREFEAALNTIGGLAESVSVPRVPRFRGSVPHHARDFPRDRRGESGGRSSVLGSTHAARLRGPNPRFAAAHSDPCLEQLPVRGHRAALPGETAAGGGQRRTPEIRRSHKTLRCCC